MDRMLCKSWWIFALQGAAALLFAILALLWPGITLLVFVALFAAYALTTGVVGVIGAIRHRREQGWWLALLLGMVGIAAGLIAMFNPGITLFVLILLVAANAIVTGLFEIVAAVRLRKELEREWLLALTGAIAVVFGILVFLFPPAGALAMVLMMSFYALASGVLLLTLAYRARKWAKERGTPSETPRESPRPA